MPPKAYPGWKLGEKKSIKAKETVFDAAQAALQAKAGSDWTLEVDWAKFGELTEGSSYRSDAGRYVYDDIVGKWVELDIKEWDDDFVAAINKKVSGTKKVVFTMGPASDTYKHGRCNVDITENGITLTWKADYMGYSYTEPCMWKEISNINGISATSPLAGEWTLAEIRSVAAAQGDLDKAIAGLKAKAGDEWTIKIDWGSWDANTKGSSYRSDVGRYVITDVVLKFLSEDVAKFDDDVVEALNDAAGEKVVEFTCGKIDDTYSNGRADVQCGAGGVTIKWKCDYMGYSYTEDFVNKWVLANC